MTIFRSIRSISAVAAAALLAVSLTSCSQQQEGTLLFKEPWIKATSSDMTAVFTTVENPTDKEIVIKSATVAGASMTELHETIIQSDGSSVMQEKQGGLSVPAKGSIELKPSGDHIMPMGLSKEIKPGDKVKVTLQLSNDKEVSFEAEAKEYTGALETYAPDMNKHGEHGDHSGHEHGDHSGHEHGDAGTDAPAGEEPSNE